MKHHKHLTFILLFAAMTLILAACSNATATVPPATATTAPASDSATASTPATIAPPATSTPQAAATQPPATPAMAQNQQHHQGMGGGHGPGQGMGMGGPPAGMRERHQAPIPEDYQGKINPIPADDESLARGEEIYVQHCATCHGDGGMGDGPSGQGLDPAPAPIAHASQMLSDSYLFWRVNEGGIPFYTAMIAYKNILSEDEIWDVINYVRALGSGQVQPGHHVGGEPMDPNAEAQMHDDMLAAGIELGVLSQDEADLFTQVHAKLDAYKENHMDDLRSFMGSPEEMQAAMMNALVESGEITQEQADTFASVHDRLVEAGIMQ